MCDTFVALGNITADGSVIFGKNSDREPNEAHEVVVLPAADYPSNSLVNCTYIQVPQVAHTYAVLLAKPFWIWGAEMGLNEHGVAIGNEAIFTRVPQETRKGLIGMDFLRLALERSRTAFEALRTITSLLETYGQGGNCGFTHPFYYDNSFILADPDEAWVLETAGRQWVAEKVKSIRSISNAPTIGAEWDLASSGLVQYAVERKWCRNRADFHFARCYADFLYTRLSDARSRQACTTAHLEAQQGNISLLTAMSTLRSHGMNLATGIRLDEKLLGASVCMHAGAGPVRNSQTVGSLVAHLTPGLSTAWVTATAAPCTSIYKPVWIDAGFPLREPSPTGRFDRSCLWWRHEQLHRAVLQDYNRRLALYEADRDTLETAWVEASRDCTTGLEEREKFSAACFFQAEQAEQAWLKRVQGAQLTGSQRFHYKMAWRSFNKRAGLE